MHASGLQIPLINKLVSLLQDKFSLIFKVTKDSTLTTNTIPPFKVLTKKSVNFFFFSNAVNEEKKSNITGLNAYHFMAITRP